MVRLYARVAIIGLVIVFAGVPVARAATITINIPQFNSSGFEHGTDYVFGIAGVTLPAGNEVDWASLTLLAFHNYEYHSEDYIRFGFVRDYAGALGWSTRSSAPGAPAYTDIFWTITGMPVSPATYGPEAIPGSDLSFMDTKFGIYLDPNCHYYGSLRLTYDPDSTPVPEPATLTLLGLGLAGTAAMRRRRRR